MRMIAGYVRRVLRFTHTNRLTSLAVQRAVTILCTSMT